MRFGPLLIAISVAIMISAIGSLVGQSTVGAAAESLVQLNPYTIDIWPEPDGGAKGTLTLTWRPISGDAVTQIYKYLGHGTEIRSVVDRTGRPIPYTTTETLHELGLTMAFDPAIPVGKKHTVIVHFYQDHVWHADPGGQQILLDMPWLGEWNSDVQVEHELLRVHVPRAISSPPIAPGWVVQGQVLEAFRSSGAASLSVSFYAPRDNVAQWQAPLVNRVPLRDWLLLGVVVLCGGAPLVKRLGSAGVRVSAPHPLPIHVSTVAALVSDHDRALVAETCLMTLVEKNAIQIDLSTDPSSACAIDLGWVATLTPTERGWYDALFDSEAGARDGQRCTNLEEFFGSGGLDAWERVIHRQLAEHDLLQSRGLPGLNGWSFKGWAVRETWRATLRPDNWRGPATAALGVSALAIGLILSARALGSLDGYVETVQQQFLIPGMPIDGMPVVRLYNTLGRLIPLPPSHTHDFHAVCNGTCGSGRFLGEHSCALSGGGPGTAT